MNDKTIRSASEQLLGELRGGISAALTAVPVELVYGLFAVAPLGAAFAEHGVRAALWGCILVSVLSFMFRGTGGMITGTRPATALILGALAMSLIHQPAVKLANDPLALVFTLLLLCTALAGLFQFSFGMLRVGRALKYIPYPVTAGLMLGVGVLMLISSLRPALGAGNQVAWSDLFDTWHPTSLVVTGIVIATFYYAKDHSTKIPGSVLALIAGSVAHHAFVYLLGSQRLGGSTSSFDGLMPQYMVLNTNFDFLELIGWLPLIASYALTIATLGTLETLLCLSAIGNSQGKRLGGDHELRVQGLSNLIAGLVGATASVGNPARVNVNFSAGGRGRLSTLAYAISLGIIVVIAGKYFPLVPYSVTAAIVICYAIGMVDDGTHRLVKQVVAQRKQIGRLYYRALLENLVVVLLVASVAVIGDMMKAVGIGLAAAIFLFVKNRMKPAIRRVTHGDLRHSLKVRTAKDMELLSLEGGKIAIIEVDGPLFFGTADSVANEVEKILAKIHILIIDIKRVHDIDPTGARTLLQVSRRLVAEKKQLLISGATPHFEEFLNSMGLEGVVPKSNWHHDLDRALEDAEEKLLKQLGGSSTHNSLSLHETALAAGLTKDEIGILVGFLAPKLEEAGTHLFSIGEMGDSLFVAGESGVDILVPLKDGRQKRLVSLAPGVIFGEMALLEGGLRSASAVLLDASTVWGLSRSAFDALLQSNPGIARQVLINVGRQLAGRLRAATSELMLLEDH